MSQFHALGKVHDHSMYKALEDSRDCTFKNEFKLKNLMSADNDLSKLNFFSGYYFTPHFLQCFDIRGLSCREVIYQNIYLAGFMLGFKISK